MANQQGKGWFAIMLGKQITYETVIPNYIIEGIIFAKYSFKPNLISDIII